MSHASPIRRTVLATLAALALLSSPTRSVAQDATAASTAERAPLDDATAALLRVELREMLRADQRVRYMNMAGSFSPCEADQLAEELRDASVDEYISRTERLKADAAERLSQAERTVLLRMQQKVDVANFARLMEIVDAHGWPSPERVRGDSDLMVLLLHVSPDTLDAARPVLLAEVLDGRMPAIQFASALDKSRKIRGQLQLYGTGDEFDPATRSVGPPRIADIDATNAARAELGLPPLEDYRLVDGG